MCPKAELLQGKTSGSRVIPEQTMCFRLIQKACVVTQCENLRHIDDKSYIFGHI